MKIKGNENFVEVCKAIVVDYVNEKKDKTDKTEDIPKTRDESNLGWMWPAFIGSAAILSVFRYRENKVRKED